MMNTTDLPAKETKSHASAKSSLALVLGATGGIGQAYCRALAVNKFDLILSGRNVASLDALAEELRSKYAVDVQTLVADLCDAKGRTQVTEVLQNTPHLNWFVNAAGVAQWGASMELSLESQRQLLEVNLVVPMELVRSAIHAFQLRGGGTIVHIASAAAFFSVPFLASYCASKGAIVQWLTSIREEIRGKPICLQALCPGFVKTQMFSLAGADAERLPSWIWISPERIARESIRAAAKNHPVCIPGKRYRLMLLSMRLVPTSVSRRVAGWLFGNFSKYRI
jgi:uncharacterized protein